MLIKIQDIVTSKTNPRGAVIEDAAFKDLVASIKEKGMINPIIVREVEKKFEIVGGHRRFAAIKKILAPTASVEAIVKKLTDEEAAELAIIDNLQRQDIHPLEEAVAYRNLVENKTHDMKSIAAKVGKSEAYIRGRIFLTNLCAEAKTAYREGVLTDGHAAEIARLSPQGDQQKALTYVKEQKKYGKEVTTQDLHSWAQDLFVELNFQPWLKDKEAMAAVGPCVECPKDTPSLFGEVKVGACTTTRCLKRKMVKYINWFKKSEPDTLIIRGDYGQHSEGVIGMQSYDRVKKGSKDAKKALIVEGEGRGKIVYIKTRSAQVSRMTPEQKKKHDAEVLREKAKRDKEQAAAQKKEDDKMSAGIASIAWPLKEKHLDVLFEIAADNSSECGEIVRRLKIPAKRDKDGDIEDAGKALAAYYAKAEPKEKARIVFELLLLEAWRDQRNRLIKKL